METFPFYSRCTMRTDSPYWRSAFLNYRVKSSRYWSLGTIGLAVLRETFSLAQTGCTSVSYFSQSIARMFCLGYIANLRNNYLRPIVSMIVCSRRRSANSYVERAMIAKCCQEVNVLFFRRVCGNDNFRETFC